MSFRELLKFFQTKREGEIKTKKRLLASGMPVVKEYANLDGEGRGIRIRVFLNGYVLYEEDGEAAVFHVGDVLYGEMKYDTVCPEFTKAADRIVPQEVLMEMEWYAPLMMEGNERVSRNSDRKQARHAEYSRDGFEEELKAFAYDVDFLKNLVAAVDEAKRKEVLQAVESAMKPVQWKVFVMIEGGCMKQREVAEDLGVTQQYVSREYVKACRKVAELEKAMKKIFDCD